MIFSVSVLGFRVWGLGFKDRIGSLLISLKGLYGGEEEEEEEEEEEVAQGNVSVKDQV